MRAEVIALKFLELVDRDIDGGGLRPLGEYQRRFPGNEDVVAEEYERLTASNDPSPGPRSDRRRRIGGRYRVLDALGRGGFAEVYLAEDEDLHRRVAVKVLCGLRALRPEWRARLRREAVATNRIQHDGVCPVHDIGFDADVPFLVMPWIEGRPLDRILSAAAAHGEAPISLGGAPTSAARRDAVLQLIERLARTLAAAHRAGVVHRDVKPANVLVRPDGAPVLIDFGLAALESADPLGSRSGRFGTPAYAAPEVLQGRVGEPDPRVDIWGLGVLLFECLTLQRPFVRTADRSLESSVRDDPVPQLPRDFGRDLQAVLETALARSPADRYPTAGQLADDLARVRRGQPIDVRAAGPLRRAIAWGRARPGRVGVAALLVSAIVAGASTWVRAEKVRQVASAVAAVANVMGYLTLDVAALERAGLSIEERTAAAEELLATARRLRDGVGASAIVDRSLAETLDALGGMQIQLGRREAGTRHVGEALALRSALLERGHGTDEDRAAVSHALILLGDADSHHGRFELALQRYRRAQQQDQALLAGVTDDPKRVSDVAFGHLRIAHMLSRLLRLDAARIEILEAVARMREAARLDPNDLARRGHVAAALLSQASIEVSLGRPVDELIGLLDESVDRYRQLARSFDTSAESWRLYSGALRKRTRLAPPPDPIGCLHEAVAAAARALELQPASPAMHLAVGVSHQDLAAALAAAGRFDEALREIEAARVSIEAGHALDERAEWTRDAVAAVHRARCRILDRAGATDEAERAARTTLRIVTAMWEEDLDRLDGWKRMILTLATDRHPLLRDRERASRLVTAAVERGVAGASLLREIEARHLHGAGD